MVSFVGRERRWPVQHFSLFHVLKQNSAPKFQEKYIFERKKRDIFNGLTTSKCSSVIMLSFLCIPALGSENVQDRPNFLLLTCGHTDLRAGAKAAILVKDGSYVLRATKQNDRMSLGAWVAQLGLCERHRLLHYPRHPQWITVTTA